MNKERYELLQKYIKLEMSPLLLQNISSKEFEGAIILKSNIEQSELNGHYEGINFMPPTWYQKLIEKSQSNYTILIIENINEIPNEEQTKFIEILKYKKISTFNLPKNCLIIVTCSDLNNKKINEEVYSLLIQI